MLVGGMVCNQHVPVRRTRTRERDIATASTKTIKHHHLAETTNNTLWNILDFG